MINYFLYRINADFDGFTPEKIRSRMQSGELAYNWGAYIESINKGDLVLTSFHGRGCERGIYAISRISSIDFSKNKKNVRAKVIHFSSCTQQPLIDTSAYPSIYDSIFKSRMRGAELVVPQPREKQIYGHLAGINGLLERCKKMGVLLPGSPDFPQFDITEAPRIRLDEDVDSWLKEKKLIGTFWIRPKQTPWMTSPSSWLTGISYEFSKFKNGDLTNIELFADALEEQVRSEYNDPQKNFSAILSIPLCKAKHKAGEVDRVMALSQGLSDRLKIPILDCFKLAGNVSRRRYKNEGHSTEHFCEAYKRNLKIFKQSSLKQIAESKKSALLIDDVFTDGATTGTIISTCQEISGCDKLNIVIASLGVMAKKQNLSGALISKWSKS